MVQKQTVLVIAPTVLTSHFARLQPRISDINQNLEPKF